MTDQSTAAESPAPPPAEPAPFSDLTGTQRLVAVMLARGHTRQEIAAALDITSKTVDSHRGAVMRKAGARTTVMLARMAIRAGLVSAAATDDAGAFPGPLTDVE